MMDNFKNFIKTSDEGTYKLLLKEGFVVIGKEDGKWIFLNNNSLKFSGQDTSKILYTDILNV